MSDHGEPPRQRIQAWSKDKLDLLAKYLHAYSTIMRNQKASWLRSYTYVDAFANVGAYDDVETNELVNGSPAVALNCDPPFDEYWFIERSSERLGQLRSLLTGVEAGRTVRYVQGDSNAVLTQQLVTAIRYENRNRAFVFLDPYGFQVGWETVRRLAEARAFDIFVNFPIMGVNRILDRDRRPDDWRLGLLQRVMGRTDWVDSLYHGQTDLFGEEHHRRGRLSAERLALTYITDIKDLFGHASRPVVMTNSTNAPLYALFVASHNRTAIRIANDIFKRYERLRV